MSRAHRSTITGRAYEATWGRIFAHVYRHPGRLRWTSPLARPLVVGAATHSRSQRAVSTDGHAATSRASTSRATGEVSGMSTVALARTTAQQADDLEPPGRIDEVQLQAVAPTFVRAAMEDVAAIKAMVARSSPESRLRRFFSLVPSAPEGYLEAVLADGDHHAYVVRLDRETIGLAELHRTGPWTADLAVLVEDAHQRRGIGRAALQLLICCARAQGVRLLSADMQFENSRAIELFRKLGTVSVRRAQEVLHMELDLHAAENQEAVSRLCADTMPASA